MATCANCGATIPVGNEIAFRGKGKGSITTLCGNCAVAIERAVQAETENPDIARAALFGLAAALVSSLIWYFAVVVTEYELGIIAIAVGWLVAQAVMYGAGRKRGPRLQAASVAITVLAMAFSEYLIVRQLAVVPYLAAQGITDVPLLVSLEMTVDLIVAGLKASPLTLLFWAIAVYQAYALPARRQLRRIELAPTPTGT